ncbi:MAG TPA: biotin/lipoyl-containing protein, partial [Gemmatimonadaceae bacterium]|nr:biotin/lipoyl-containing protein [Gemmatimonadaceae bacterium]
MAFPIRTPRINNNDDVVRLSALVAEPGAFVRSGDLVAEVETDKATFGVEADRDGYLLAFLHDVGEQVAVGSVLAWMGETAGEPVPEGAAAGAAGRPTAEPTLRAALLLAEYGILAADVAASGERLSVADVEAHAARLGLVRRAAGRDGGSEPATAPRPAYQRPEVASDLEPLSVTERGMLRTVAWHRDEAVTGYVE